MSQLHTAFSLVLNESGTVQEIWVLWEEVEQFHIDGTLERRYVLDRIKGTVSFPDGRNGLIPLYKADSLCSPLFDRAFHNLKSLSSNALFQTIFSL